MITTTLVVPSKDQRRPGVQTGMILLTKNVRITTVIGNPAGVIDWVLPNRVLCSRFHRTVQQKYCSKLHQAVNLTAADAMGGTFWGMLIGMIFLNPLMGAAIGAGAGALSGKLRDLGISDNFMEKLGETFQPGTSALFVLARKATPDKVLEGLKGFKD